MQAEYMAASTSSAIIPRPPGNFSILLMPRGLKISKNRKSASETMISHHGASWEPPHNGSIEMSCPTVSSTHAATGSFPQYFSETELAHVPAIMKNAIIATDTIHAGVPGHQIYSGSHKTIATRAPHVPGATGKKPAPKEVAISLGKRGNLSSVIGIGLLDFMLSFVCMSGVSPFPSLHAQ